MAAQHHAREVDLLVRNLEYLVTVDRARRVIRDGAVAIDDGRFVWVGSSAELPEGLEARSTIDGSRHVAVPGFVDCHLHASFQLSRGLADEANAREFLVRRMYPYEAALTEEDVAVSAALAGRESLLGGTTCFVDPGNQHPAATASAVATLGGRLVLAQSAFDLVGSDFGTIPEDLVSTPETAQRAADTLIATWDGAYDGRIRASVSFRGLNNSSDDLIRALAEVAQQHAAVLQTHACFNYSTHDASVAKTGLTEIRRLAELGALSERTMLVHCGWLEPDEVALLQDAGAAVVAAPSSSMHNGYGNLAMGVIPELIALGVRVGLGTDHACSGAVDMVREMFLAACGYKEVRINPRVMPPETVLEMATVCGAEALGLGEELGSVATGKRADLVLFDADRPEWQPLYNPVSNLVYSATGHSVDTVLVNGDVVVEAGRLTHVDEEELVHRGRKTAASLFSRLQGDDLVTSRW